MSVSLCIASRGRPAMLADTIHLQLRHAVRADTRIVVALDRDDVLVEGAVLNFDHRVLSSVAAREDSLGAKYNRCAAQYRADVYALGSDDVVFPTPGWDQKLQDAAELFTDGLGLIYFGKIPGVFQPGIAITQRLIDAMGYFCVPYFPYWWHDTWPDEIGHMIGRIVHADVAVECRQGMQGTSRGVRDIAYWARFFDETRPLRRAIAERVIAQSDDAPWRKRQLRQRMPDMEQALAQRNAGLRDPARAQQLEAHYGFDAPEDERYRRIKANAEALLATFGKAQAA